MDAQMAGGGHVRVRPVEGAGGRIRDRHASADRIGHPAHGQRVLVHPHRSRRALHADARQGRVLPDGLGRQRAAHRTPGAERVRRAVRSGTAVRPVVLRAGQAFRPAAADLPAQLHRTVRAPDRRRRGGVRGAVAPARAVRGLVVHVRHDRVRGPADQPACVPAQPGARRGVHRAGADPVGRDLPDRGGPGRTGGPGTAGRLLPPTVRAGRGRHDPAGTAARVRRAGLPSRGRALRTPGGHDRPHSTVHKGRSGPRSSPRRPGQGYRHRHGLHLRRPHRRHLVAGAGPADPRGDRARRPAAAFGRRTGRPDGEPGAAPDRRAAHRIR